MLMCRILCSQRDSETCCFTATSAGMQVVTKRKLSTMLEAAMGPPPFLQNLDPNTWEVRDWTPAVCLARQPAPLIEIHEICHGAAFYHIHPCHAGWQPAGGAAHSGSTGVCSR